MERKPIKPLSTNYKEMIDVGTPEQDPVTEETRNVMKEYGSGGLRAAAHKAYELTRKKSKS